MKIRQVKELENGVSGITIEGKIIKTPKEPRDSEYGWSQMIILKDDTGEMSSWINIESAEDAYKIGQYVKIKGKVSHYKSRGKDCVSLNNANVEDEIVKDEAVSQEQPIERPDEKVKPAFVENKEYTKDDYWREKALRDIENNKCIVRECAIKAVTELVGYEVFPLNMKFTKEYFKFADEIVDYIYNGCNGNPKTITSEAITKEFGGTKEEERPSEIKVEKIAKAKELVLNPHLAEPVNDNMATVKQKRQTYGYIDVDGKKIGGMVDSQYIKEGEVENIGKAQDLTKKQAIGYWNYWYGKDGESGERKRRELEKGSPFVTKSEPIEKKDPKDDSSLVKDLLIEAIYKQREELHLKDDEKFKKEMGYNPKLEELTEKELLKLTALLKDWRPDWMKK